MEILIKTETPDEVSKEWKRAILLLFKAALEEIDKPDRVCNLDTGGTQIEVNRPKSNYREYNENVVEIYDLWGRVLEEAYSSVVTKSHGRMEMYEAGYSALTILDRRFRRLLGYQGTSIMESFHP